ncbi:MAG TPA: hypothetical protein VGR43_00285 [Dehalococcoidia bacterium]|jgi:hypothetical protein|nr:hypothetical protein [Dehalococcoidia bacterium]
MREAWLDRPAGDYAIFDGTERNGPVIGKVVAGGLPDEINDRQYLVVDGTAVGASAGLRPASRPIARQAGARHYSALGRMGFSP